MDSSTAGDSAATGRTVGGRSVNFSGHRGRPPKKKPSFGRDDRLARDGARLMTGPFRPPGKLPFAAPAAPVAAAPAAASASIVVAVGRPAFPPPAAAASAAVNLTFSNAGDDSDDSGICVVGPPLRPAGNKGKTPFVCLTEDILRVMQD